MGSNVIDTNELSRSPFVIKVVKVFSPTLIWVHLKNTEEYFQEMMKELDLKLSNSQRPKCVGPKLNEVIAVETRRGWQRAAINKFNADGTVQLHLRDWGEFIRRTPDELYCLEEKFKLRHWEAIPCSLAYIRPAVTGSNWSHWAIKITRSIAKEQTGFMRIIKPIHHELAFINLDLKNETSNTYHNLRDLLIQLGVVEGSATITTNTAPTIKY